jgi:hypothetical protein
VRSIADPKRERRLAAIAAQSAAKWQRVRFRDNREPSTLEPNGHGWLGKGDGAPHPRETQEDTR